MQPMGRPNRTGPERCPHCCICYQYNRGPARPRDPIAGHPPGSLSSPAAAVPREPHRSHAPTHHKNNHLPPQRTYPVPRRPPLRWGTALSPEMPRHVDVVATGGIPPPCGPCGYPPPPPHVMTQGGDDAQHGGQYPAVGAGERIAVPTAPRREHLRPGADPRVGEEDRGFGGVPQSRPTPSPALGKGRALPPMGAQEAVGGKRDIVAVGRCPTVP